MVVKNYAQKISGDQLAKLSAGGGSGGVTGPVSATDSEIALFDGVTGKAIKGSAKQISDLAAATHTHASITNQHSGANPVKIWTGTQAEYDALGTYDADTLYFAT